MGLRLANHSRAVQRMISSYIRTQAMSTTAVFCEFGASVVTPSCFEFGGLIGFHTAMIADQTFSSLISTLGGIPVIFVYWQVII